ncbi:helix-turn-helix domain-containing protein [Lacrimispora sp. 38-1]|uniref:helix-turn-helix domain-containing protein n=1 Tax=Lacrimispora sp. 38-1 TaxID=3125778 RepID=UPI003CEEEDDD
MDKKLFFADTKYSLSYDDMIECTQVIDGGIIYFYNRNYIIGKTTQYEIFDGIWLVYHDLVLNRPELYPLERDGFIQINYCISGRCELHYKKSKVFYIGAEDFIVALLKSKQYKHCFPLGNYIGISIITTKEKLDHFLQVIFPSTKMTSSKLLIKLEEHAGYFVLANHSEIKSIIQEINQSNQEFFREKAIVKFAELILLLMNSDMELQTNKKYYDKQMVNKVKHIKHEVTSNIELHVKIEEIAIQYQISAKAFSECFKEIYGKTYYAFVKEFRIKKAADLLQKEDYTIGDISIMVGYQNASKFSKAFCDVMGVTPIYYRKNHSLPVLD